LLLPPDKLVEETGLNLRSVLTLRNWKAKY